MYKDVIGLKDAEIAELEEKKVIGDLKYEWAGPMPGHIKDEL